MPRMTCAGDSVTKRSGAIEEGRTLQRPPPLMRIFRPPSRVRSSTSTAVLPRAAKIAAMSPAAPAPTTTIIEWEPGTKNLGRKQTIRTLLLQGVAIEEIVIPGRRQAGLTDAKGDLRPMADLVDPDVQKQLARGQRSRAGKHDELADGARIFVRKTGDIGSQGAPDAGAIREERRDLDGDTGRVRNRPPFQTRQMSRLDEEDVIDQRANRRKAAFGLEP